MCDDDDGSEGSGGSGLLVEPIVTNEGVCACMCACVCVCDLFFPIEKYVDKCMPICI